MVMFGHKTIHINLLKYQIQINKRCGNCKSRKPAYKFLTGTRMSLESKFDDFASIAMCDNAEVLA